MASADPNEPGSVAKEDKRFANEGNAYTEEEFLQYYGATFGKERWNAARPFAVRWLGKPQLGGYVCTHNTSNATEHADAPPIAMHWPTSSKHNGSDAVTER